jgi:putative FmdB family regulatory protein
MPIYEYACRSCSTKFDQLVRSMSSGDATVVKCPRCGSTQTTRALSLFAVSADASKSGSTAGAQVPADAPMCGCGRRQGSCGMG